MTSPEGRLRCGRPSAFVPAILPPPINSNFGASPTRFSLSTSRILLLSSKGARLLATHHAFPLPFLSARLSLPRSGLTSCAFVHMSPRPLSRRDISHLFFLPFYPLYVLQSSPPSPVLHVRFRIFDSFEAASFCMESRLNEGSRLYEARCLRTNCFYPL